MSLFCGSCVIESLVNAKTKILNDKHEYLIEMYKALQNGYELPDNLSKEQYYDIKANKDRDKALTGFVGFGCSFGGKWFGGYAQNRANRNYCLESKKHTMKLWDNIKKCKIYLWRLPRSENTRRRSSVLRLSLCKNHRLLKLKRF